MLQPFSNSDRVANIIGIDPGSQTLGLSVLSFDLGTYEIVQTQAQTFQGDRLPYFDKHIAEVHGERLARIYAHRQNLVNLFLHYRPISVACESPFFNARRPNAFAALMEVMNEIRNAVMQYNPYLQLVTIDPPTVKKSVGAPGNADKTGVLAALILKQSELRLSDQSQPNCLDEHSVDATAVAYCRYKSLKLT